MAHAGNRRSARVWSTGRDRVRCVGGPRAGPCRSAAPSQLGSPARSPNWSGRSDRSSPRQSTRLLCSGEAGVCCARVEALGPRPIRQREWRLLTCSHPGESSRATLGRPQVVMICRMSSTLTSDAVSSVLRRLHAKADVADELAKQRVRDREAETGRRLSAPERYETQSSASQPTGPRRRKVPRTSTARPGSTAASHNTERYGGRSAKRSKRSKGTRPRASVASVRALVVSGRTLSVC
jgi:hypothetical protein